MMKNLTVLVALLGSFVLYGQKGGVSTTVEQSPITPSTVVVKFKSSSQILPVDFANARVDHPLLKMELGINSVKQPFAQVENARSENRSGIDFAAYQILKLDEGVDVNKAIKKLSRLDIIEFAEPLYLRSSSYTPNDFSVDAQREYLEPIRAFEAWDISRGSSDVVIAIIDAAVDYEHEDLRNKIQVNEDEVPNNGIDDDNDGFVDNYYGWDFAGTDFNNVVEDNDPLGKANNLVHGSWVAGFAAAETDNEIGMAGVGFNCKYMALKCGADNDTRDGGNSFLLNTLSAVIYAADQGADVINMSYGGTTFSQFGQDVMTYAAVEKGVVLVAAAGNESTEIPSYPAAYQHVISVAATDEDDVKTGFSNFGSWVDIAAPGETVVTTANNDGYASVSGTSFSSPIVAGAAGLLRSRYPDFDPFQISQLLIQSADLIDTVNSENFAGKLGTGRLNIERALTTQVPAFQLVDATIETSAGEQPSRGESGLLDIRFKNSLFNSSSAALLKIFVTDSSSVNFNSNQVPIGVVSGGEEVVLNDFATVAISEEERFNKQIGFAIVFEDSVFNYSDSLNFTIQVNTLKTSAKNTPYLLADGGSFEVSQNDFANASLIGEYDIWELGVPGNVINEANSDSTVWKTLLNDNLPKDSYANALQSPVFDFSDTTKDYRLSFYKSMESEFCNAPAAVQMQYSTDGETWSLLGSKSSSLGINWYNKAPGDACEIDPSIIPDQNGWIGNFSNERTEYNVSALAGESTVTFRFVLYVSGTFNGDPDDGFMIDDFQIEAREPIANFASNRRVIYTGDSISFTYLSGGAIELSWNFGDGGTDTTIAPSHVYNAPGIYDVSLSINSSAGRKDTTIASLITVLPNLGGELTLAGGGDFESNLGYFGVENVSGSGFTLGNDTIPGKDGTASGNNAWVVAFGEPLYEDLSEAYLYSPNFDFEFIGNYTLGFKSKYVFEDTWDGFIVEYSLDKGSSWTKLNENVEEGWYNTVSHPDAIFGAGVPIFSGSTAGVFEEYETSVAFLSGESSVAFRVVFLTDPATVDVGMAIDDFFVTFPQTGAITADFVTDGYEGCQGQEIEFKSTSVGSITSMTWDFGANASVASATGPGPHRVTYDSLGATTVTLTVGGSGTTLTKTFEVLSGAIHTPTFTYAFNGNGNVDFEASEGDSYQWYLAEDPIEGATEQLYEAVERGSYSVEVTIDGCAGTSVVSPFIVTDLEEELPFTVYPNPVSKGVLSITGLEEGQAEVEIHDFAGRRWDYEEVQGSRNTTFDVSKLPTGQYILSVWMKGKSYKAKLIIQ